MDKLLMIIAWVGAWYSTVFVGNEFFEVNLTHSLYPWAAVIAITLYLIVARALKAHTLFFLPAYLAFGFGVYHVILWPSYWFNLGWETRLWPKVIGLLVFGGSFLYDLHLHYNPHFRVQD